MKQESTAQPAYPDPALFSLAILISTRNRAASLRRTLESLAAADRSGIALRIIVIDNSQPGETLESESYTIPNLPLRIVREEREGKCHALNRGLRECGDAEIVAVLDDDITVDRSWFSGVRRITNRWPDKGFFTGSLSIVWPSEVIPDWARAPELRSWAFSALSSKTDRLIGPGRWASGNHFWFRAKLLPPGYQFSEGWLTEPPLMLDLAERGFGGVIGPDAVAHHHIEPDLLDADVLRRRAIHVGRGFAEVRLKPYRRSVKQAALFRRHPLLSRLFCHLNAARWFCLYCLAGLSPKPQTRVPRQFKALERMTTYRQYTRTCRECDEYRILRGVSDFRHRA